MTDDKLKAEMTALVDETSETITAFLQLFDGTGEGRIKRLLAAHCLMASTAEREGIPDDVFHLMVPALVGVWLKNEKPDEFSFMALTIVEKKGAEDDG